MGRKDRKRLSAILDGESAVGSGPRQQSTKSADRQSIDEQPADDQLEDEFEEPVLKKSKSSKGLTDVLKDSKQEDFLSYLKEENPEMLEDLEECDLGELSGSSDEEDETDGNRDDEKLDGEDSFDEDGFDFGDDDDLDEEQDDDQDDDQVQMGDIDLKEVTEEKISKWNTQLASGDHKGLLPLAQALYASIVAVDDRENEDKKKQKKIDKMTNKMTSSTEIFPIICSSVIEKIPEFLLKIFAVTKKSAAGHISQNPMWKKCKNGLKVLLPGLIALMERLLDVDAQKHLLNSIRAMTIFFIAMPGQRKPLLKMAARTWSQSNEETLRVQAFLVIHKVLRARPELLDQCLRQLYLSYVGNSKFVTPSTLPNVYFMQKCLIELYQMDANIAYQHGFLYIRQLGIHLRKAMMNVSSDTLKSVANWQFVSALQLWCKIIADSRSEDLAQLHLPAIQIIFGVFELISNSPRLAPLTLHMLRSALLLCGPDNAYVPLWTPILDILSHIPVGKGHKDKNEVMTEEDVKNALPDLQMVVKLQAAHCKHKQLRDALMVEFEEVCLTYSASLSHKIDYPDVTLIARKKIKEFSKKTKNPNHRNLIRNMLKILDKNADFIIARRENVDFGPTDAEKIAQWEKETLEANTPLLGELEKYRKARMKTRMTNLQRTLPTQIQGMDATDPVVTSYNRFLDTEEGKAQRAADKAEFPDLFDDEQSDKSDTEMEPEPQETEPEVEPEEDPLTKISKKERKALKIGKKDEIADLDINNW